MKKILFFLLIIPACLGAQTNLSSGLVLYYPFNGSIKDESGFRNDPSVINARLTTDRFGKANSACLFNGKSNYIRIPDHHTLRFSKGFSISAWVKVNDFYEGKCHGNRFIMKGFSDNENGNYMLTCSDNYSTKGQNCFNNNVDKKRQSFYAGLASPFTENYVVPGKWYLLTYTYDGYNGFLYVDCQLWGKGSRSNYHYSNNEDLFFGKMDNTQYPYWFNGVLDEVRIYNRALKKEEITALCNKTPAELNPDVTCAGQNKISAKFTHTVTNCITASFDLETKELKNISAVRWDFGDGTSSSKAEPTHTYKKNGTYKVKATLTAKNGCVDVITKQIVLRKLDTDFSISETEQPGRIMFRAKNNTATYSWDFGDGQASSGESQVMNVYTAAGNYTVKMFALNNLGCTDTVEKKISIILPPLITEIADEKEPVALTAISLPTGLEKREKDIVRTIPVENELLQIRIYDNGIVDGDSITLVHNGRVVLFKQALESKPLQLSLKLDPNLSSNELVMYAENLGTIPPNTALMVIMDGNNRYEVNISSNKQRSGAIAFTLKKKQVVEQ